MINVAAIRMQQFGVHFYQASLTAGDIDKLVRFEVLNYGESGQSGVRGGKKQSPSKVNWDLLERRIASSEKAYQRQIIRRKIDELVQYYEQCRQARDLPSIAGAVIISCDEKLTFEPVESGIRRRTIEGARARGHPPRHRRPAPTARPPRRHRKHQRRGVHGSGDHLRPAARGSRRADVRHHQREAHEAECVASRESVRASALPRRRTRGRSRCRACAQRSRRLAASQRNQTARRGSWASGAGTTCAGIEEAVCQ